MAFSSGDVLTAANLNDLDIDSLTVDTSTLVVDKTNNKVGINTASPMRALDVTNDVVIHHSDDDHAWLTEVDTSGVYKLWYQNTYSGGDSGWNNYLQILGASSGLLKVPRAYSATTGNSANLWVDTDGGFYRSTSSAKYKTDVETMEDEYADAILNLRPVWFRSNCDVDNKEWSHWGFIAEEVADIDPRLVFYGPEQEKDADGNLIYHEGLPSYKKDGSGNVIEAPEGVQYDRIVPALINIIKRQEARITALENA